MTITITTTTIIIIIITIIMITIIIIAIILALHMASKNISTASNFWTDYRVSYKSFQLLHLNNFATFSLQ